jgi:hypothetical protein
MRRSVVLCLLFRLMAETSYARAVVTAGLTYTMLASKMPIVWPTDEDP